MSYTLIVRIRDEDMSDEEYETFPDAKNLSLFRKGRTLEDLEEAMSFWTARGFSAWIYQTIDSFTEAAE